MKTIGTVLFFAFGVSAFTQNTLASLFHFNDQPIDFGSCYNATPMVAPTIQKGQVLFQSNDGGTTWNEIGSDLPNKADVSRCFSNNEGTYIGTFDGTLYFNSDLQTSSWELQQFEGKTSKGFITGIFPGRDGNYASVYQEGFYCQIPGTNVWKPMSTHLEEKEIFALLELEDGSIMVGGSSGIYRSIDDGKSWKHLYQDSWVNSLTLQSNIILTCASKGILRSTDHGQTWNEVFPETGGVHKTILIDGYFVIIHGGGNSVSVSLDGITWKPMDPGKPGDQMIYDINKSGEYMFSSRKAGISRSNDFGKTWQLVLSVPNEFAKEGIYCELVVSGSQLFAIVKKGC